MKIFSHHRPPEKFHGCQGSWEHFENHWSGYVTEKDQKPFSMYFDEQSE